MSEREQRPARAGISRRELFTWAGAAAAGGLLAGGAGGYGIRAAATPREEAEHLEYAFDGAHQAGIVTPQQEHLHFAAFDLRERATRDDLVALLEEWTYAARRLTLGLPVGAAGAFDGSPYAPPADTGEAADHGANGLTITFGFGRSLFETADGRDRFGLRAALPPEFTALPTMVNDFLEPQLSDGDLCVQVCANDPQVAVHAVRNLTRIAVGTATLRWAQLGFGRAGTTSTGQSTPRNLFGQKDGTHNIKEEERDALAEHVWIDSGPAWAHGGTYLCARKIAMSIEVWDSLQLGEQDRVLGRAKGSGAPLTGGDEFTAPDFAAVDDRGKPVIDQRSHVFRSHPDQNDGIRMLRRPYNYVDGNDETGRLSAGQFFIAYVKSPERFARVHQNLARDDMFVEYLKTRGSGVFLVPPGVQEGEFVGQALFAA